MNVYFSQFIGAFPANEMNNCIGRCQENERCFANTIDFELEICLLFTDCGKFNVTACPNCITNAMDCYTVPYNCWNSGFYKVFNNYKTVGNTRFVFTSY